MDNFIQHNFDKYKYWVVTGIIMFVGLIFVLPFFGYNIRNDMAIVATGFSCFILCLTKPKEYFNLTFLIAWTSWMYIILHFSSLLFLKN